MNATDAAVAGIADAFELPGPVVEVGALGGLINDTFLVVVADEIYVVQRINQSVFADPQLLVDNAATVTAHLAGELVPEMVAARSGGWLVRSGDDAWRAWRHVAGMHVITPRPDDAQAAGRLLAQFHAGLADLDPDAVAEVLPGFHDPARRLQQLRDVVAADPVGRVEGARAEIDAAFAAAPLADVAADLVARVPRRVAHNDAKLENFLFGDPGRLVDLDTVMPTAWFWDVGDLLRTAGTRAAEDERNRRRSVVDPALYDAVLAGYCAVIDRASPTVAEQEALEHAGAIVTYEQALRFLTDWIAGDVYYRITRPGQNRHRARAQLALLASMPGTVAP
jgi:hypothetical protein